MALSDAVIAAPWAGTTLVLACAAWRVSHAITDSAPLLVHALNACTLGIACIIGAATALGTMGLLSGLSLLCAVALLASVALLHSVMRARAVATVAARSPESIPQRLVDGVYFLLPWSILAACGVGHVVTEGLLTFPTDFDSLMYHMPLIDHWLQAGSLYAPDSAFWSQPGNSELIGLWMVAPFSGDYLIGLNNAPFIVVWALAAFSLARALEIARVWSHLAVCAVLAVFTIMHESDDASNDLAVAAFFMAGSAYGMWWLRRRQQADLVLCGICIGLLAGVKFFALGYAAVVWGAFTLAQSVERGVAPGMRVGVLLAGVAMPFGSYWYLRNAVYAGEPLYPMTVFSGHDEIGYPGMWQSSFAGNGHPLLVDLGLQALWNMAGPCHYAAVLLTPFIVAYLLASHVVQRRRGEATHMVRATFAALVLGSGCVLAIIPFALEDVPGTLNHLRAEYTPIRYGLSYLSCAVLGLALMIADLSGASRRPVGAAFGSLSSVMRAAWVAVFATAVITQVAMQLAVPAKWSLIDRSLIGGLFVVVGGMIVVGLRIYAASSVALVPFLGVVGVSVVCLAAGYLSERWHAGYATHFNLLFRTNVFTKIDAVPSVTNGICVLDLRAYPFFGSRREYCVVQPRRIHSCEHLAQYMQSRSLQVVALGCDLEGPVDRYQRAIPCVKQDAKAFHQLGSGLQVEVFTLHGGQGE